MLKESFIQGPAEPPVRDLTIGDALREAVTEMPDKVALIAGSADPAERRQWTYSALLNEAERAARALLERFEPRLRTVTVHARPMTQEDGRFATQDQIDQPASRRIFGRVTVGFGPRISIPTAKPISCACDDVHSGSNVIRP